MCETHERVLSDVHTHLPPIIINSQEGDEVIAQTKFHFRHPLCQRDYCPHSTSVLFEAATVDEDGDYVVARKPKASNDKDDIFIVIDHRMSTRLQDVGLQVWNAALLLCDFICCHGDKFKDATVLELGGGLGLSSIVMAMVAKAVYCTDIRHVLECCERNIIANKGLYGTFKSIVVRELNWLQETLNTDHQNPFHWRKRDIDTLQDSVNVIMAADVIYENDLTDAFFRTIYHIMTTGKSKMLYVSIEKRVNFTIVDLDATAEAYDHFKECLEFLQTLGSAQNIRFNVRQLPTDFNQYFNYTRAEQLELWEISTQARTSL